MPVHSFKSYFIVVSNHSPINTSVLHAFNTTLDDLKVLQTTTGGSLASNSIRNLRWHGIQKSQSRALSNKLKQNTDFLWYRIICLIGYLPNCQRIGSPNNNTILSRRYLWGGSITIQEVSYKIACDKQCLGDHVAIEEGPNIEIILDLACKRSC